MIQKTIFKEITKKLTGHQQLVDVVSEVLGKSSDSAYRRIRGEKELTLSESVKLCFHFDISLDSMLKMIIYQRLVVILFGGQNMISINSWSADDRQFAFI